MPNLYEWAENIRRLPRPERAEAVLKTLNQVGASSMEELMNIWEFWARPEQLPPKSDWRTWLFMGGRGAGKTRAGAEFIRHCARQGISRMALVAQTAADAREVMIDGESGLRNVCWMYDRDHRDVLLGRPEYQPSRRRLVWNNGATAYCYSAEDPEQLRGPQHEVAWADEFSSWANRSDTWSNLQFGLRLKGRGRHPRQLVTTTPKPFKELRELIKRADTVVTRGGTRANAAFLSAEFLDAVEAVYKGTRLGRQELDGELLLDVEGAFWSMEMFDAHRIAAHQLPKDLDRVVVAVDPSGAKNASDTSHDKIGIVVAGRKGTARKGHAFVIADKSKLCGPKDWAKRSVNAYYAYNADAIIAETNYGGAMVEATLKVEDPNVRVRIVTATRGKVVRAEPISALYEGGRVSHVGILSELEDQLCGFAGDGYSGLGSPDNADAAIWALYDLMVKGTSAVTKVVM